MCGILAVFDVPKQQFSRNKIINQSKILRHRGPDWSNYLQIENNDKISMLCHERLSIIDPNFGFQPLSTQNGKIHLIMNGEIYNHVELREKYLSETIFQTNSDCEVVIHLYEKYGIAKTIELIDGMWSFVIYDNSDNSGKYIIARDPIGITPLYFGIGTNDGFWVASESKALINVCSQIYEFKPGYYYTSCNGEFKKYFDPRWDTTHDYNVNNVNNVKETLRNKLENAVTKRLMSDVKFGVLLSGGLDSSLVASIAKKHVKDLYTFSIGIKEDSPDILAARKVAKYIGSNHYEFAMTVQDGIDVLEDVIYHLETYDITTIRASVPMFLLGRKINSLGVKMVLSGEGADEIFGGYLYFHKAPNKEEFHKETIRKISLLHKYDCKRANLSTSAWGIETRVPFLDKEFLDFAMKIDPEMKMVKNNVEKYLLRETFDYGYLPDDILWRQKEQFSDGVGYSWINHIKEYANNTITDEEFNNHKFVYNPPETKEGYLYRVIFEKLFNNQGLTKNVPDGPTIACSTPIAYKWSNTFTENDASGRSVKDIHLNFS
jgi:asparagine synthase (glutamine-hydrolysing)